MNTLFFIAGAVMLGLVILAKIPGLEHMVRPVIDLVFTAIKAVLENMVSWTIWLIKMLLSSHIEVVRHLLLPAEKLDPSVEIRKNSDE